MSIVKARCLKCNEEINVESNEDAGICPKCGSAYVTEKAIKHYNEAVVDKSAADFEYEDLSALVKKYSAFVKLYKTNYDSYLELYRFRAKIIKQEDELEEFVDKHNKMVDNRDSWRDRYNGRVDGYNDARYNAYETSISKSVHKKFVESAKKKHDSISEKIKDSRKDYERKLADYEAAIKEEDALTQKVYGENLEYNIKALAVVKEMCERYPSNPLGYLYYADWHMREIERGKDILKYMGERYDDGDPIIRVAEADANISRLEQLVNEEAEKAEKFMTEEFRVRYAELLKPLKKVNKPQKINATTKSSASSSARPSPLKKSVPPVKGKAKGKTAKAYKSSTLNWVASVICLLPIIAELLIVLLIPHIKSLNQIEYVSRFGWNVLSVPMRVAFLSVLIIGVLVQVLGLFDKLNNVLGMFTQLMTFALFVLAVFAANNNAASVYTQWGIALLVPISLVIGVLRYMSPDSFDFIDDFGFWHYVPIALEVAEYALFFLVFPLMFGVSASLWIFIAITVTTVAAIIVTSLWEDFRWIAVGINLAVAALLCVVQWLGKLFTSEWMSNGGAILVVVLAIGGSIFISWFIHRDEI